MTAHLILLDNRYENDDDSFVYGTGDILGENQWHWLDLALKRGKERDVELTVIGAGLQMLTEMINIPLLENFRWKNRERLFRLLRENRMENVVLLSGDVHIGQVYKAQCTGFTGQNLLPEVTSSGLSHT